MIAWISIGAIILGTAALILVLSVFNGFEGLVKNLYSSFYTDLRISPVSGKTITLSPQQLQQLRSVKSIKNFSLVVEEKALVQNGENQSVVYLKGVDDQYRYVTGVAKAVLRENNEERQNEFNLGTEDNPMLILGIGIEGALGIRADRNIFPLKVYLPRKTNTAQIDMLNDISSDTIRTSGAFAIQQDFDNKYGITNIDFVKQALGLDENSFSSVEIALQDPLQPDKAKAEVQKLLGTKYLVETKYEQNRSLYAVMNMERWVIYGVLSLILVVAAFNMIGALTMLVLEKQKDISVLQALGANKNFIQKVFLSEGILLGLIGTGIGMFLALLIIVLQIKFHLIPLQGGSFLIDYFPVKPRVFDFVLVAATVFVIALLASWIPSKKAAAQVFSLRSE